MKGYRYLLLFFLGLVPSFAHAAVSLGARHVYILYPGVDAVWGSYVFTVNNSGDAPERFTFPVLLPKETIDFQGQDSLDSSEIKLGSDGGVTIDKEFRPGENMMQVGFKLPASQGTALASMKLPYDIGSLGFFVWQNGITVHGEHMEIQRGLQLSDRVYDAYSFLNGKAGDSMSATLQNVPEGRGRLWIIGWIFCGLIVLLAFGLAYASRPKTQQIEDNF